MTSNDVVRVVRGVVVDDQNFPINPVWNLQRPHAFQRLVEIVRTVPGTKEDGYGHSGPSLVASATAMLGKQCPAAFGAETMCPRDPRPGPPAWLSGAASPPPPARRRNPLGRAAQPGHVPMGTLKGD